MKNDKVQKTKERFGKEMRRMVKTKVKEISTIYRKKIFFLSMGKRKKREISKSGKQK